MAAKKKTAKGKATTKKTNSGRAAANKRNPLPTYIITMLIITVLLAILLYIDTGEVGIFNGFVKLIVSRLFGVCGYFIPVLLAGVTAYLIKTRNIDAFWKKLVLSGLALINVSAITQLAASEMVFSPLDALFVGYADTAGGFLGTCVALFLDRMVQRVAAYIILFVTLIVLASVISGVSLISLFVDWVKRAIAGIKERRTYADEEYDSDDEYYDDEYYIEEKPKDKNRKKILNSILDAANSLDDEPVKDESDKRKKQSDISDSFSDGIDDIFSKMETEAAQTLTDSIAADSTTAESAVKVKDKPKKAERLSEKEKDELLSELLAHGISPIVYAFIEGKEKFSYLRQKCNRATLDFLLTRENDSRDHPVESENQLGCGDVFYFTCIDEYEKLKPLYLRFKEKYHCIFQRDIYGGEQWLEIIPKHVSKANAILQLKELLGIDYVVAFGDGKNDIDMFEIADEAYAVENAAEELKALATGIIESNDSDGVAKWLSDRFSNSGLPG